uniref:Roadblock/LAMTOR2 domain-containing protein n=1 Tax=Timema tahoe TaxID=61484 RepID=A0A7R9FE70_9NEOP|nr:unnamed protein product [Timema tahoe]
MKASEIEETMKRIQSHKGVVGTIVVNNEGIAIKTTMDNTTTTQYSGLISQLSDRARSVVRDLDPTNDLTFLRIRSKKHEIMVAPAEDNQTVCRAIVACQKSATQFKASLVGEIPNPAREYAFLCEGLE